MPRIARLVAPDVPHHVTQRGNRREPAFSSDADYGLYLDLLGDACGRAGTAVWAWCLMPDRVHLVLVPAHQDGLRAALGETHRRYAWAANRREGRRGPVWQSPFTSFPMDEACLLACVRSVELGPVRAGLVARPEQWRWSSARAHLGLAADPVTDLEPMRARVPDWRGLLDAGLDERERGLIEAAERSGWPLGGAAFLQRLAAALGRPAAPRPRGRPRRAP
ncbi:MAG: REP-associated tyrosine transposase [Sphingomonadales bacterium]|jgi:putative transposase|nr:REP-associated tyrosine transposase [Sphingomonadales bacterium]